MGSVVNPPSRLWEGPQGNGLTLAKNKSFLLWNYINFMTKIKYNEKKNKEIYGCTGAQSQLVLENLSFYQEVKNQKKKKQN